MISPITRGCRRETIRPRDGYCSRSTTRTTSACDPFDGDANLETAKFVAWRLRDERIPFDRSEYQCGAIRILRIPHADQIPVQVRDFYTIVPAAAMAGLEPSGIG